MARGIRVVGAGVAPGESSDETPRARPRAESIEKATPRVTAEVASPARKGGPNKMWSGRLAAKTARRVEEYTSSVAVDRRLFAEDIEASVAHAGMLRSIGVLSAAELRSLEAGLRAIRREFERDEFEFDPSDEDIHSAVERRLFDLAGTAAAKLHTGRSRNDQVATDLRLYSKRICRELMLRAADLQEVLIRRAEEHRTTLLPGYTHMQRAQVVSLAHHLLAYVEMLQRDISRLTDAHRRSDVSPLGSGALSGSTLPLDRAAVARALDFESVSANSLDAVADRDFAIDVCYACALAMVHLSRLSEELVLWCSTEFSFADLPDAYATGSSLMPQKKNPDILELARGRSARVIGDTMSMLTLLKGLPLAYNRDLQEDKQPLFDATDTLSSTLLILTDVMAVIRFDRERMLHAASDPALVATDVAEYLVRRGVAFREAHAAVGQMVRTSQRQHRTLAEMSLEDWQAANPHFGADVQDLFAVEDRLRRRELAGAPGPRAVSRQLVRAATMVARTRQSVVVLARQPTRVKEIGAGSRRPSAERRPQR